MTLTRVQLPSGKQVPTSLGVDDYFIDGARLLRVHAITDDGQQVCLEDAYAFDQPKGDKRASSARFKVEWRPRELVEALELVRRRRLTGVTT